MIRTVRTTNEKASTMAAAHDVVFFSIAITDAEQHIDGRKVGKENAGEGQ